MKNLFIPIACLLLAACNNNPVDKAALVNSPAKDSLRPDFKKYYDAFNVKGCFVLFNLNDSQYIYYNKEDAFVPSSPASTFKIPNTMIGLETGVISDENFMLKWDGVKRGNENWNQDTDLKMAYKNSTVWYYQELARRVGLAKMKDWVQKIEYGNKHTGAAVDIDIFWLNDTLKISPMQQIDFLTRLSQNKLPFSKRTVDITKNIMIAKDTTNFTLRAKTGWDDDPGKIAGWYVGYIDDSKNTYVFANRIETADTANPNFARARIAICYSIFKDLGLYKGQ